MAEYTLTHSVQYNHRVFCSKELLLLSLSLKFAKRLSI